MRKRQWMPHLNNGRMIKPGHFRHCRACGDLFEMRAGNQVECSKCSGFVRSRGLEAMEINVKRCQEEANQSGNPKIWRRGDLVDMLPEGMKKRIEMVQRFGV